MEFSKTTDKMGLIEERTREADNLKRYAFIGISLSTILTIIGIVAIPGMYSYMQYVQMQLEDEVNYCRVQSRLLGDQLQQTLNKNPV
uniref:Nematode cuticle collagen N-terminal domain-containing protein n=1 Tax=Panagrolaimus sp. PS1159 TaxID=55785 RepID=A0AC35F390_9BILA